MAEARFDPTGSSGHYKRSPEELLIQQVERQEKCVRRARVVRDVRTALNQLPFSERSVVKAIPLGKLSEEATAALLNLTVPTVKRLYERGCDRLRMLLAQYAA